jgi:hypothetical protein
MQIQGKWLPSFLCVKQVIVGGFFGFEPKASQSWSKVSESGKAGVLFGVI